MIKSETAGRTDKITCMASRFLCAFRLVGIAFAYSKFVHQILPNRSELLNEVSIICPYNNSVLEREKQKRKRRFKTSTASFAMPDARSNRSGRRRRPDNQQCRATGFTYISPPSPSFPICYEKTCALCSGQGFAACPTQRAHRFVGFISAAVLKCGAAGGKAVAW